MMRVLGLESSCDETAAAVVDGDGRVYADVVASQVEEHAPYGGVVPELASRAHLRAGVPVVQQALAALPGGLDDVDAVAVTQGPGLVGALLVGIQMGKALAFSRGLPLVGVDHLTGHLLAVHLRREGASGSPHPPSPAYPYIALLASGGHTALYEVAAPDRIHTLGQTRDDAAGEAFDKVAKLLGLGYPGGPIIDRLARDGDPAALPLALPMHRKDNLEFSFSGLKTAIALHVQRNGVPATERGLRDLAASFQATVVESLVRKSLTACRLRDVPRLVLTGGVAANRGLRARAREAAAAQGVEVFVPPVASCTDNAAMIAYAGALRLARGERDDLTLRAYSRSPTWRRGKF